MSNGTGGNSSTNGNANNNSMFSFNPMSPIGNNFEPFTGFYSPDNKRHVQYNNS